MKEAVPRGWRLGRLKDPGFNVWNVRNLPGRASLGESRPLTCSLFMAARTRGRPPAAGGSLLRGAAETPPTRNETPRESWPAVSAFSALGLFSVLAALLLSNGPGQVHFRSSVARGRAPGNGWEIALKLSETSPRHSEQRAPSGLVNIQMTILQCSGSV